MIESTLKQATVLVVGGSSGIGLAVAELARREGARVVVASRRAPERMAALPSPLDSIEAHAFDILAPADHVRLFEALRAFDHLVVAVRSDVRSGAFLEIPVDEAKSAFETKFWGLYRLIQTAHPYLRASGSITLTSGIAGEKIYAGASTMALINSATETLCQTLAVELAPVRVNCVSPGFVAPKPARLEEEANRFPLKRLAAVEEVASAYLWLMANPYTTGTVSVVDGGARLT
ncbi:short-chain dehydrogenase/reductase SDR [Thiorhodococcus drewsii AZ1]|uniref:Short-chain dehydrogenase/reductase SDR n=1 Tax=Thiorhodococcus drewsii AZ1 TaxID=765913 RepID=G2DZ81_9GAMM|nr:SDR family oxidoreductase [Thiorhodococcus drewsii]EGV32435.1 short-chain dehydrogenase/reductase SDR [Thiorhodococcus drewsii AZ1]